MSRRHPCGDTTCDECWPQLHTTKDAARILNVPENAIWNWRHRLKIQPRDVQHDRLTGRRIPYYALADLRPLVEARVAYRRARGLDTP